MPLNIFGDGYGFDEDGKCGFFSYRSQRDTAAGFLMLLLKTICPEGD